MLSAGASYREPTQSFQTLTIGDLTVFDCLYIDMGQRYGTKTHHLGGSIFIHKLDNKDVT